MMNAECRMKDRGGGAGRRPRRLPPFSILHSPFCVSSRAFTLLELIVVMLVLAVLFAMAAPAMSGFGAGRAAKQTAPQIVSLARWAREQAISEGRTYRLNFDPANQGYFVTTAYGATFERVPVEFGRNFTVPEGVALTFETPQVGGVPCIDFLPSGRSQPGHVRITSRDGDVTDLACLSATEPLRVVTVDEMREAAQQ
jgi:prepilin-type N-terminal cleavage/methylation domain-containing protein